MPMSPDDYKVLERYVSPRDIDAVVSPDVSQPSSCESFTNLQISASNSVHTIKMPLKKRFFGLNLSIFR